MKRRNFFKKIAGTIAGVVIAPFIIEAKENEVVGYVHEAEWEYLPSELKELFEQRKAIHKRIIEDPNILNGLLESKERHEQRKKLYKPITTKLINK